MKAQASAFLTNVRFAHENNCENFAQFLEALAKADPERFSKLAEFSIEGIPAPDYQLIRDWFTSRERDGIGDAVYDVVRSM